MQRFRSLPRRRAVTRAVLALGLALQINTAAAAGVAFDIPAQPLAPALNALAGQAGLQLVFAPELAQGKQAPAVQGTHEVADALRTLLAGSGLQGRVQGKTLVVERAAQTGAAADAATLAEVRVTALAERGGVTEGTGSYTTGQTNVSTGLPLSLRETPQSVSIVTRQRMDDMGLSTMEQALTTLPGISALTYSESTVFTARGFGIGNLQIDGMTMNHNSSSGPGAYGNPMLDTAVFDRIEVLRGASGLLSGTGDPSATVNLVRKRPGKTFAAHVAGSVGSWNLGRAEMDISAPLVRDGSARARLVAAAQKRDSFIDFYSLSRQVVSGTVEWDAGPATTVAAGFDWQQDKPRGAPFNGIPAFYADGTPFDAPRSMNMTARWSRWDKDYNNAFVRLDQKLGSRWNLRATYSRLETHSDMKYAASTGPYGSSRNLQHDGSGLVFGTYEVKAEQLQHSVDLKANGQFSLLGREHDLVIGFNGWDREVTTVPINSPAETWNLPNIWRWDGHYPEWHADRRGDDSIAHTRQGGAFANARFNLTDAAHLFVGGRLSRWRTHTDNYDRAGVYTGRSGEMKTGNVFTPYAGLTYDLNRRWTAYASYTDLFKPQTAKDKDGNFLDPIVGSNVEAGLKFASDTSDLQGAIAIFETTQDNLAERDTSVPEDWRLPDGSIPYTSTGKGTKTRGLELEVSGSVLRDWQLHASYAYARTRTAAGDAFNTHIPRHMLRLFTTYRLPGQWRGLTVGGGLSWQSAIFSETTAGGRPAQLRQSGYALINLMAEWRVSSQLSLGLQINNLTDKRYRAMFSGRGSNYANYGEARNVQFTARYRF